MSLSSQIVESSEQVVLILVGLIASGKSTFAQALEHHFPHFRRCNQDDLGNRKKVENLARRSLGAGHSVCIDRTNINAEQRAHWIKIARQFGAAIWVIVFDTPYDVCAARLQERTSHPTITTPELGLRVLLDLSSSFQEPHSQEGYERLLILRPPHITATYSHGDMSTILQRVRQSPPILPPTTHGRGPYSFRRGYPRRGFNPGHPCGSQGWGGTPQGPTGNSRGRAFMRGSLSDIAGNVRGNHVGIILPSIGGTENLGGPMNQGSRPSHSSGSVQDPVTS